MTGYTGENCLTNVNGCASNPCLNGGTCHELADGYTCICPVGLTGSDCNTCTNADIDITNISQADSVSVTHANLIMASLAQCLTCIMVDIMSYCLV